MPRDLQNNKISQISPGAFAGLKSLKTMYFKCIINFCRIWEKNIEYAHSICCCAYNI